jgi:hypothetical protein
VPPLKNATKKPSNIGELIPPATPTAQNPPPIIPREQPGLSPTALGPAPAVWTTGFDSIRQWVRPGTSQSRFPSLPTKSNPQINASSRGVSSQVVAPVVAQTSTNTTNIATNTAAISNLQATSFQGAFSLGVSYAQGASVTGSDGKIYVSRVNANLGHDPTTDGGAHWQAAGSEVFLGAWSGAVSYVIGNVTSVSTQLFFALQNSTNQNPTSTTGFWQLLNPSTIAAYSGGTTYFTNNLVSSGGGVFAALQTTTGNAPPTPPSSNSFWSYLGPSSLSIVPDGSSRFGNTASGLVYRPLSNPLTGHDAGSNVTINIAAFTMRTSSKGDISENSGSVTGLSYNTLYYIYFSDPSLSGGAVTHIATTTRETAISNGGATGQFFVGSIITPLSGQPDTIGNNDGGSGTLGTSIVSQVFAASGTWTKPAGALYVQVTMLGAGGGGGGSSVTGGGGGGGGAQSTNIYPASVLTSTVAITIGTGGGGGATGVNGNPGGTSSFGAFLKAGGGGGGTAGGGGSAAGGAGGQGTSNGGNGGNGSSASGGPGSTGQAGNGLAAGGGGGGGSAAGGFGQAGGVGGAQGFAAGGAAGGTSGSSGVPGGAGASVTANTPQGGSAGGGGGSSNSNVGSAGGPGGSYGAAGGGGGGAITSGGNGAPGICVVTTFL